MIIMKKYLSPYRENGLNASEVVGTKKVTKRDLINKKKQGSEQIIANYPTTKARPNGPWYERVLEK